MTTPNTGEIGSLGVARAKLANAIEIFAPIGNGRSQALELIGASLIEYEAAVREDERAKLGDTVALAQAAAIDATAQAHGNRVAAEAALAGVAQAENAAPPAPVEPPAPEVLSADAPSRKRK